MFLARSCLEAGAWDHALAICDAFGDGKSPALELCRAVAHFVGGERAQALALLDALLASQPALVSALAVRGEMAARSGDRAAAIADLRAVLERYPDYPRAHGMLASLLLPGPHYRELLAELHRRLRPRVYLEIGVDTGATLALAAAAALAIGIDPGESPDPRALPPNARVYRETSDAFFEARARDAVLGERRVDLGFIDGLHWFEQVLRDFANLERWAHADATIVLHDCVPVLAESAARTRSTKFWVGDTWKAIVALRELRPDLRIRTLLVPPSGLVVIRRLNPGSRVLDEQLADVVARLAPLEYTRAPGDFAPELGAVPGDARGLAEALG